jgi:hypothetical protein
MTIEARDQVLAAVVQDIKDYAAVRIRFGMHFADAVILDDQGNTTTADLSRISLQGGRRVVLTPHCVITATKAAPIGLVDLRQT